MTDALALAALIAGAAFFLAGTVGLVRFPDVYTRLHAVTKADNAGLGLVLLGLAIHGRSWRGGALLLLTWLLVLLAGTTGCHLIARRARQLGVQPWSRS